MDSDSGQPTTSKVHSHQPQFRLLFPPCRRSFSSACMRSRGISRLLSSSSRQLSTVAQGSAKSAGPPQAASSAGGTAPPPPGVKLSIPTPAPPGAAGPAAAEPAHGSTKKDVGWLKPALALAIPAGGWCAAMGSCCNAWKRTYIVGYSVPWYKPAAVQPARGMHSCSQVPTGQVCMLHATSIVIPSMACGSYIRAQQIPPSLSHICTSLL